MVWKVAPAAALGAGEGTSAARPSVAKGTQTPASIHANLIPAPLLRIPAPDSMASARYYAAAWCACTNGMENELIRRTPGLAGHLRIQHSNRIAAIARDRC
jgi:hypothetical protein